jgi:hypothetical protein
MLRGVGIRIRSIPLNESDKMNLKTGSILILLVLASGCSAARPQESKLFTLPSGKQIKVTGISKMDFPKSDSALVMNYETGVSIDDTLALRKEVDEIWALFQKDVENAGLKAAIIRAIHVEGSGLIKNGKRYGFVFEKREDGKWHCLDDDKQQK